MTDSLPSASERQWLTPGVCGIGAASLLADLGHEVPTSLLPALLTSFGAPAAALGLIEGVADALAGAARFAGGPLADDPRRRRSVAVGGYAATALLSAGIGAAQSVVQVALLRSSGWIARGLRVPARNALLADLAPCEAYGRAYGFERTMDNLGAVGGPLLALALVAVLGIRGAVLASAAFGLAAAIAIVYAVRQIRIPARAQSTALRIQLRPLLAGELGRLWLPIGAFEAGKVATTLLILRATELLSPAHGLAGATRTALLLYAGHNLVAALIAIPAGRLADRFGFPLALAAGIAAALVGYAVLAASGPSLPVLAAAFAVVGISIGVFETAAHGAVAAAAPESLRGSAFGLLAAIQSGGNLLASAIAGVLWTAFSPMAAFAYAAGATALALLATRRAS